MSSDLRLQEITTRIRERFERAEKAREQCLARHREVIRMAGLAIRAVHRREFDEGRQILEKARGLLAEVREVVAGHEQVYYAGYVQDAQKEFAEACLTLALVRGEALPSPQDLLVEDSSWLNGLGEAVGELRRYVLDMLRRGDFGFAEPLLERMDEIYYVLTSMDYPDALTRGLRRTTDVARGCIEKTRGDLTHQLSLREMERKLEAFSTRLS